MRVLIPVLAATIALPCSAQDIILETHGDASVLMVRGIPADSSSMDPLFQGTWRSAPGAPEPVFQFQRTSAVSGGHTLALDHLILAGLGHYLDSQVRFGKSGVESDRAPGLLMADMNGLALSAAEEFGVREDFTGFSAPTMEQMERLLQLDWSKAAHGIDAGDGAEKYLAIYHFVRSQREELERQIRADLLPLSMVQVLAPEGDDPGRTVVVPSVCGTVFDEDNFLCALDLTMSDSLLAMADPVELAGPWEPGGGTTSPPGSEEAMAAPFKPRRKRDRWLKSELDAINQRIDRMDQRKELWQLRDRIEDLDDRMDDIQLELADLQRDKKADTDNPIANLSALTRKNVTIRFERNSNAIEAEYRVLLNEVFEQLARSPADRVLITGFTDRSGDPAVNLWLSEQRAKAVRRYLMERGIADERMMVNYYGDSRSIGRDPEERRVEIEWLRP
ncbi:MAG: OmpA family protein [Flavobacteriales bacterium]|nr:OmpA family protein [Flavobacteriales bacterium]